MENRNQPKGEKSSLEQQMGIQIQTRVGESDKHKFINTVIVVNIKMEIFWEGRTQAPCVCKCIHPFPLHNTAYHQSFSQKNMENLHTFLLVLSFYSGGLSAPDDISVYIKSITHVSSTGLQASPPSGLFMMCNK